MREIQLRSLVVWKTHQQSIDIRCKVWKIVWISFSYDQDHPESNFFMIFLKFLMVLDGSLTEELFWILVGGWRNLVEIFFFLLDDYIENQT